MAKKCQHAQRGPDGGSGGRPSDGIQPDLSFYIMTLLTDELTEAIRGYMKEKGVLGIDVP
jgi:hypothetical protein